MTRIEIQPFRPEHEDGVLELILGIQRGEFGMSITAEQQPDLRRIPSFYQVGHGNFWVALAGRRVVGTIALLDIGSAQGALRKMFVHREFRGREAGTAKALLDTLVARCEARGLTEIFLGTTPHFLAAHRFYERSGFTEITKSALPPAFPVMEVDTKFYRRGLVAIRRLPSADLARIAEIDRSEHVTELYTYERGVLAVRTVDETVPTWAPSGGGEHSAPHLVDTWMPILERGGTLLGAFDGDVFAGLAIYRPRLAKEIANLALLHVSRKYRRRGIAARLTREVARLARADGARSLYVSATPTGSAVRFYQSFGFAPTDAPNAELFALEPEDIHMALVL